MKKIIIGFFVVVAVASCDNNARTENEIRDSITNPPTPMQDPPPANVDTSRLDTSGALRFKDTALNKK